MDELFQRSAAVAPDTVATCCKPSSGAGVVWMETTLERLGSNPRHEEWRPPQGDPTEQLPHRDRESQMTSLNPRLQSDPVMLGNYSF